ncbi:hypothetical protein [Georgenia sp. MJ170]|uniref:hypothetical protein n=1 Tax=Georgenia sunbinii TaxID=3117728 RepID=UPI002F26A8A9
MDLAASARSFLECVDGWDTFTVEAASPAAERVLGAAMMLNPDLRGGCSHRTVILDVNIASGTLVANAARRIRESTNAEWLIAVVINSLTDTDLRWSIDGVDSLFVCNQSSEVREGGQRADNGVGVRAR